MTVTMVGEGDAEHMERCGVLLIDEHDGVRYAVPLIALAAFRVVRDGGGDAPRYEVTAEQLAPYLLAGAGRAVPGAEMVTAEHARRLPVGAAAHR
ncbi:MAG: hypothetical protein HYX51_10885 [Chloroflexi bacterium]|nr:hypothetical protein [Chloroflexota bacterium]